MMIKSGAVGISFSPREKDRVTIAAKNAAAKLRLARPGASGRRPDA
jgi:hypothetical protein